MSLGFSSSWAFDLELITSEELATELASWVILDGRPQKEWAKEHIPGAIPFSWEDYTRTDNNGIRFRLVPVSELEKKLGNLGITEYTPVAVYGDADTSWGGEGWICWLLAYLGHKGPVRFLSGGLSAWKDKGFLVEQSNKKRILQQVTYQANLHPEFNITALELQEHQGDVTIVDVRSDLEWLRGHIPGAIHIPWREFYTGKHREILGRDSLEKLLSQKGVPTNRPIAYYCTGGIRSGFVWLGHMLSGFGPDAINFEGGMEEWKKLRNK